MDLSAKAIIPKGASDTIAFMVVFVVMIQAKGRSLSLMSENNLLIGFHSLEMGKIGNAVV